jgi:heme/copper-type cytochrome/quinol oxidase subunit 4
MSVEREGLQGAAAAGKGGAAEAHTGGHASVSFYVLIGAILAVVTGVEVAIFYLPQLEAVATPLLVLLSASKIVLVIMFFMHLKMDPGALTWIFLAGAFLGAFMVTALVVLYHLLPGLEF